MLFLVIWCFPRNSSNFSSIYFFIFRYLNAIQTTCPHILRYLTTAVITNKRRRTVLKDLVKVIQQESYTYKDPITEFLECLYVNFDFDGAQQKLRECETVSVPIVTVVKDLSFLCLLWCFHLSGNRKHLLEMIFVFCQGSMLKFFWSAIWFLKLQRFH